MDYYELMMQSFRRGVFVTASLFSLTAAATTAAIQPAESATDTQQEISNSDARAALDAELFYEILLGEITTSGGDSGSGYALMLEAARRSGDSQLYRRAADIALQSRAADAALIAVNAWKQAHPASREANRYALQILIALNRIAETPQLLKQELAQSPPRAKAATLQAIPQLYGRASDKALAASVVEQALADELIHPAAGPLAWTAVGRMQFAAGNKSAALKAAREAQTLDPLSDGAALLSLQLLDDGVADAEPLVARYLAGQPVPEIRMAYVRTLLGLQRYADAGTQTAAILRDTPDLPEAWLVQATLQLQSNRLGDAEASAQRFIQLLNALPDGDPRRSALTQGYLLLAQIAEKQGHYPQAEAWLSKIDNASALLSAQHRRASLLARQGKLSEARALLQQVPAKTPEDQRAKFLAEVQLLRDAGQYKLALDVQGQAVKAFPQDNELLYDQAMLAERAGDLAGMEQLLKTLIARQPDYHHAYNALGYSLAERGIRLPEAKQLIAKALEFAPGDPFITDSLGWVEFRLGNHREAARLLEEAFKKQPDAEIAAHLGEVLWTLGERDRAAAVWKQGVQLNPDNATLRDTLTRLRVGTP